MQVGNPGSDGPARSTTIESVPGDGVRRPVSSDVAPGTGTEQAAGTASDRAQPAVNGTTADTAEPAVENGVATPPVAPARSDPQDLEATQPLSAADEPGTGFGLASAPTGRRVRARLARFNAPWQSTQV